MKPASFGTVSVIGLFCVILTTTGCPPETFQPDNGDGDSTDVVDGGDGDAGDNSDTVDLSGVDTDDDGVVDEDDNCPDTANADQADGDGDGIGDACDFEQDGDGDGGDAAGDDGSDGDGDVVDTGGGDGNTVGGDGDDGGGDGGSTGSGGGGTGGGGTGGVTPDTECTLSIADLVTNPESGTGDLVMAVIDFDGPEDSFVTINPIILFEPANLQINQSTGRAFVNLECEDVITFGLILFTDATGFVTVSDAELTLQRGVDYTCGDVLQLSFSLPCSVDIE